MSLNYAKHLRDLRQEGGVEASILSWAVLGRKPLSLEGIWWDSLFCRSGGHLERGIKYFEVDGTSIKANGNEYIQNSSQGHNYQN